ncbi:hypothetical protein D210916BOD24_07960 [Alteromonas sp. D210916BOD_24]|uniref:O-antigen ligase family protein n=1 Tax=Alteromonas sp. D210916BOD_24 TaxID=3157618 RepID=UPI00399D23B6
MINILLFLGSYAGGILYALLASPMVIFALYQAVYFYNPQNRWWGSSVPDLPYSFIVVVVMGVLFIKSFRQFNQNQLLQMPQFRWMYFLLLLYGVASFYAAAPAGHSQALVYYLKLMVIMSVAFKMCESDKDLNIMLYGYIYGAWYISFMAMQKGRNGAGRIEGIGTVDSPDANGLAAAIAPSAVLCLYFFWTASNNKVRFLIAIAGAFIANGIVLINSRGAFLAVALSCGLFMWHMYFSSFQRKFQKAAAIGITLVGLLGAVMIVDRDFIERMHTMTTQSTENVEQETGATRFIFWQSAWDMAKDYPFGKGFQGFNVFAPFYLPEAVDTGDSRNRSVHSTWFETLTEVGYLGLFAFIMMLYACYRTSNITKKALKERADVDNYFKVIALQCALLAFVIAMTFMNRMRAEILYWCILFIACAYNIYVVRYNRMSDKKVGSKS